MSIVDDLGPRVIELLRANPRLTQYELAQALEVSQPQVSTAMKRARARRVCDGCGGVTVTAAHSCDMPKLRIVSPGQRGSVAMVDEGRGLLVSNLGVGRRPVMVQAGEHEVFLSRADAEGLAGVLRSVEDVERLAVALEEAR